MENIRIENKDTLKERLDKYLATNTELSRSRLASLIGEGCVKVNGVIVDDISYKTKLNDIYEITVPDPVSDEIKPEKIDLKVIFEDEHLIIINKDAGMVVHPAAGNWSGTLVNALLHHAGDSLSGIGGVKRPGIVHRLDKDTSGILIVAKDDETHKGLTEQFSSREVKKEYLAIVNGVLNPTYGMIETNIGRSPRNRQKQAVLKTGGKVAITEYKVDKIFKEGEYSSVNVKIHTGRTHQIRVHLTHLGHSILGDDLYGKKNDKLIKRQALHAHRVEFIHPVTKQLLKFEAEIPEDMKLLLL